MRWNHSLTILTVTYQMKNKLIADAGSSKIEWLLLSDSGEIINRANTIGVNALLADVDEITGIFSKIADKLGVDGTLKEIIYYGAGCATLEVCEKMRQAIASVWDAGSIQVESDLLGAARSLFGSSKGIACILGTGSNSCLYDGSSIQENIPSLGFILGDEGSGAALGKRLVADAFKGHLPKPIRDQFMKIFELSLADILEYTYRRPAANRFLASLVPFMKDHIWNPYIYSLVLEEFSLFLKRNVAMYDGARSLPIAFTGSIAWHFSDILREAADAQGLKVNIITKSPMDGLVAYHS